MRFCQTVIDEFKKTTLMDNFNIRNHKLTDEFIIFFIYIFFTSCLTSEDNFSVTTDPPDFQFSLCAVILVRFSKIA